MSPLDIIASRDGSLSLTKLAAATAHLCMAVAFARLQVFGNAPFNESLWLVYGGFAIAHAVADKASMQIADLKGRRLVAEHSTGPAPLT